MTKAKMLADQRPRHRVKQAWRNGFWADELSFEKDDTNGVCTKLLAVPYGKTEGHQ
ncbi:MAG: hypothetical protein KJP02_12825 [Octadecabacter sp.]|nr:hypothetical protein [Octadecabacter sp.]